MTLRAAAQQFTSLTAVRSASNCGCVTDATPDDTALGLLIDQASDVLCTLSGGKVFGRQELTIYPCRSASNTYACGCCGLDAIPLGDLDPVVTEVKIDGVALAVSDYERHQDRMGFTLVRVAPVDRPNAWPSSQSLWKPDTAVDTFAITYTHGVYVDWITEQAAIELVCDFAADDVRKTNALPRGTATAQMGGVSVGTAGGLTLQERLDRLQAGDLGQAVSRFRSVYAPTGRVRSEVWAPELEPWTIHVKS